jgi:hypothetical protein
MDEVQVEGQTYISSKRAAAETGYAQDYIGQLSRGGLIKAQRIGGLWYVLLDSVVEYKKQAEAYKPEPPKYTPHSSVQPEIQLDGKDYASAARAADMTGYHQDYIGQLARGGRIPAQLVGNRWYIEKEALIQHKKEKDAQLAAVQAQSVGLKRTFVPVHAPKTEEKSLLSYAQEETKDLMPVMVERRPAQSVVPQQPMVRPSYEQQSRQIPIRIMEPVQPVQREQKAAQTVVKTEVSIHRNSIFIAIFLTLSALILAFLGYAIWKAVNSSGSTNAQANTPKNTFLVQVSAAFDPIISPLAKILSPELQYSRR